MDTYIHVSIFNNDRQASNFNIQQIHTYTFTHIHIHTCKHIQTSILYSLYTSCIQTTQSTIYIAILTYCGTCVRSSHQIIQPHTRCIKQQHHTHHMYYKATFQEINNNALLTTHTSQHVNSIDISIYIYTC